ETQGGAKFEIVTLRTTEKNAEEYRREYRGDAKSAKKTQGAQSLNSYTEPQRRVKRNTGENTGEDIENIYG
ncbi:MAG: hypothetical protein HC905_22640, partial [Bacteroidales bacterium]|nr:hypothetical protein [Bacteroidales bacterium]